MRGQASNERVIVYIDGFNLYYGLKAKGWRRYYWLDVRALAENLLRPGQLLVMVRYFTARISPSGGTSRFKRQGIFLEALETRANLHLHYGHYLAKSRRCSHCGANVTIYEEKTYGSPIFRAVREKRCKAVHTLVKRSPTGPECALVTG